MPEHPGWSVAKPLTESGPRDPYAHWQLSQGGYNAAAGSAALTGSPDALDVEWVAPGGTPKGDQQEIPPDGRITPLGALPADVLNGTQSPADVSVADDGLPKDIQAIVGIVDDGIAFANERFRLSNGCTRFDWLWLQGVSDRGAGGTPGPLFGTEFDHATLNAVMADFASKDRAEVHEEALYRRIGLVDPTRPEAMSAAMSASHGTAVLDRAAGCSPDDPDAEHVPIIGVNLPEEITQDTSGAILELFLILGISRILQRAEAIRNARPGAVIPIYINVSLSLTAGPKNGTSFFDRFVSAQIQKHPSLSIIFAIGNHRLMQTHAILNTDKLPLPKWRVLPDDRTPSFLEIWLQEEDERPDRPKVRLDVCSPAEAELAGHVPVVGFDEYVDYGPADAPLARAYYSWHPRDLANPEAHGQQRIVLAVPPTEPDDPTRPASPAGDWQLALHSADGQGIAGDIFAQRDDTLPGARRRGRQSILIDPDYRVYGDDGRLIIDADGEVGPVTRRGTLNALATSTCALTVTGFVRLPRKEAWYAGLGNAHKPKADFASPSEDGIAHRGVLTSGTYSGSRVPVGGTSMAAPTALNASLDTHLGIRPRSIVGPPVTGAGTEGVEVLEPGSGRRDRIAIDPRLDQDGKHR